MNPRLEYEALRCPKGSCGATSIQKLHGPPRFTDGQPCPRCGGPTHVVRNPSSVASIVYATLLAETSTK